MLVKSSLEKKIETAIHDAMKSAILMMNEKMKESVNHSGDGSDFSINNAVDAFADEAKKCAEDIATAIDEYIKSATITLNIGTPINPAPEFLISPAGPISGKIILSSPTTLQNSIS